MALHLATLDGPRPRLEDLPIPTDVQPETGWSPFLVEMAAHIGAHATLMLCDRYGGLALYIPRSADGWYAAPVIGAEAAHTLCQIYSPETLDIPLAKNELFNARAIPLLRQLSAKQISYSDAAWQLHTRRQHLWNMVRRYERMQKQPAQRPVTVGGGHRDPRQITMFDDVSAP